MPTASTWQLGVFGLLGSIGLIAGLFAYIALRKH
jgi:hypothetical protein